MIAWIPFLALVLFSAASFLYLGVDFSAIGSSEARAQMLAYVSRFTAPEFSAPFLAKALRGSAETLAMSAIGTLIAAMAGLALAMPGSGRLGMPARIAARLFLNFLRSIPELVWAALMVIAAGLGPFAGTLALALHTSGVLGRLFSETLENAPAHPAEALRNAGSSPALAFIYGTMPEAMPQLVSYSLYRWENNIRIAAVLGVVGAGGLGQLLYMSLSLFKESEAATVILFMLALVGVVDGLSSWLRRWLGRSGA